MIIVDDASNDNTVNLVREEVKKDSRIRLIIKEENSGAAVSRNIAINNASGRYIAFLDSDDLWHPKKLEIQVSFMKKNKIGFSFTAYNVVNESGKKIKKSQSRKKLTTMDY